MWSPGYAVMSWPSTIGQTRKAGMSKCGCLHKFEGGPQSKCRGFRIFGWCGSCERIFGFVSTVCSNAMWPYRRYYCTLLAWAGDAISDPFVFDLVCFLSFSWTYWKRQGWWIRRARCLRVLFSLLTTPYFRQSYFSPFGDIHAPFNSRHRNYYIEMFQAASFSIEPLRSKKKKKFKPCQRWNQNRFCFFVTVEAFVNARNAPVPLTIWLNAAYPWVVWSMILVPVDFTRAEDFYFGLVHLCPLIAKRASCI